ncbi:MAG: SWIM zinc finger family protein, partial [Nitrososphaerales archaeon]
MNWYYYYPRSTPRKVKGGGGIKARNLHGKIGSTWWSERWIQTLDSFGWTNRLERGRRYARMGQVIDFKLAKGSVEARVQGSMPKPYSVEISVGQIPDSKWMKIFEALGSQAAFAAKLLTGEMPQNMEGVFQSWKAPLFPTKSELKTDCSCPDDANPCKHIAAVYYILAEEFDRDPFMIFKLRGRTKEEALEELRKG